MSKLSRLDWGYVKWAENGSSRITCPAFRKQCREALAHSTITQISSYSRNLKARGVNLSISGHNFPNPLAPPPLLPNAGKWVWKPKIPWNSLVNQWWNSFRYLVLLRCWWKWITVRIWAKLKYRTHERRNGDIRERKEFSRKGNVTTNVRTISDFRRNGYLTSFV